MPFYSVSGLTPGNPTDLNQFVDAFNGRNDIGPLTLFAKISPPTTAPTVTIGSGSGNLTGNYQYCVAFLTGYWQGPVGLGIPHIQGNTGGGPASNTVSPNGQPVQLSNIPIGPTGTIARAIYRTKANGNTFYFLTQINDNTTTSFVDNIPDSQLGAQMPTVNTTGSKFVGDGSGLYNLPLPTIVGGTGISASTSGNTETISLLPASTSSLGGVQVSASPSSGNPIAVTTNDPIYSALSNGTYIKSGTGINVSSSSGSVTVSNTGVTGLSAGTGINVSGSTGNVTITNTGVTGLTAGTGISLSGSTGNITITNNGVTSVNGQTGSVTNVAQTNTSNTFTSGQTIQMNNPWLQLNDTSSGGSNWRVYGASSTGLQFQWYSGSSWTPYITISPSGNVSFSGQISSQGSPVVTQSSSTYQAVYNGTYITAGTGLTSTSGTNSQTLALNPAGATLGGVTLPTSAGYPSNPVAVYRAVSVKDMTLTSTSATTVLSYTPAATGQFKISGYIRVVNAPTSISVSLSFTSPSGLQSLNIVPTFTLATGDYPLPATLFEAKNGGNITLSVTSGTANNVIVSAVLEGV